tara:strand:+ start:15523 stop:16008 length:486 start_codon:yes stop_codon:yes gene_type:complete
MRYFKFSLGIFLALAVSRFIPHPPNFTSLLALSFYIPVFLGVRYIPALIFSFVITDFFIGFHGVTFFTWGSIFIIGLFSKFFANNILSRLSGALLGACIFFIITNFGVWTLGSYDYTLNGLLLCFTVALPFFGYTLISTFVFSTVIETVYKFKNYKIKSIN